MIKWSLEKRKISSLKKHPKNPRKLSDHDYKHLKQSLDKFGLIDKVIINTDNQIIGGHQRLQVLKKLGQKEIEVWVPDRTLESQEADELNIRLNRATGEWDWDCLANEWDPEDLLEWGFTPEEVFQDIGEMDAVEEDNELLEPPKDPKTKLGDIYVLDAHRLICGDSTIQSVVDNCLDKNVPILMVTDPPYNCGSETSLIAKNAPSHKKSTKLLSEAKWDKNFDINLFFENLNLNLLQNISVYIFTSHHLAPEIWRWMKKWSNFYSYCIWVKPNPAPSLMKRHWSWATELCCYATKGKHIFNGDDGHHNLNWWLQSRKDNEYHPTQKPIELFLEILKRSSNKNSKVYDPFLGSGTTLIAAEQLDRICYGIELDPAYCDIIVQRWVNYRKKQGKDFSVIKNEKECNEFI